jgi:hypothetical protein
MQTGHIQKYLNKTDSNSTLRLAQCLVYLSALIASNWQPCQAIRKLALLQPESAWGITMVGCLKSYYDQHGFVTGVPIISATEALTHRSILEAVEAERGPMHYALPILKAGEASFHHGWTVHCSKPNVSDDRRIGLNIQYISPAVKQIKQRQDSAILVRGVDDYGHFQTDQPATSNFDVEAWQNQQNLDAKLKGIQGNTTK